MKPLATKIIFLILATTFSLAAFSQTDEALRRESDSLNRKIIMDSLQVNSGTVTSIFKVRDNFLKKAADIRTNNISEAKKSELITALRTETNTKIKNILGSVKYEKYIKMIATRSKTRNGSSNEKPLAGD